MGYNTNIFTKGIVKYTDLDFSFLTNPMTDDLRIKTDLDSIKQSFKNLLFTKQGERPFRPAIGGNLEKLLFEPLDQITIIELQQAIAGTIGTYEPRVQLLKVDISEDQNDPTDLNIKITFTFLNVFQPQSITILISRIR